MLTYKTEFNTVQNLSSVEQDRKVRAGCLVKSIVVQTQWGGGGGALQIHQSSCLSVCLSVCLSLCICSLSAYSLNHPLQAWDKPVWNPVTKKELKWPSIMIPPHTGNLDDLVSRCLSTDAAADTIALCSVLSMPYMPNLCQAADRLLVFSREVSDHADLCCSNFVRRCHI